MLSEPSRPLPQVTMPLAVVIQDQQGCGTAKRSSHDAHRTSGDHETEWVVQTMSINRPIRDTLSIRKHPSTK
jgi:hypothetical protein